MIVFRNLILTITGLLLLATSCNTDTSIQNTVNPSSKTVNFNDLMNNSKCEYIPDIEPRNTCFSDKAINIKDVLLCEKIQDSQRQNLCRNIIILSTATTNSDCKRLSDVNLQEDCKKHIK